jgi:hypothetical protein
MHYTIWNFNPSLPVGWNIYQIFTKPFLKEASGFKPLFKRVLCKSEESILPIGGGESHSSVFKIVF